MKKYALGWIIGMVGIAGCRGSSPSVLEASGTVEVTEVYIASQIPGLLQELRVEEGVRVKQGDTLAVVDHRLLLRQLQQAKAAVAAADARLRLLRAGAREEDLAVARAQVEQARVRKEQAARDMARLEALYRQKSATEKQVEDARLALQLAEAQLHMAQETLRKLQAGARPEEIEAAEAAVKQAEAQRALIEQQIAYAYLTAPIDGTITEKVAEKGELVAQGSPIMVLAHLQEAYLRIYLSEKDLGRVHLGQEVEVFIDTYPERSFRGTVSFISPEAEFTPKNVQTREERVKLVYEVKITIPNPEGILKPGMYADARIPL